MNEKQRVLLLSKVAAIPALSSFNGSPVISNPLNCHQHCQPCNPQLSIIGSSSPLSQNIVICQQNRVDHFRYVNFCEVQRLSAKMIKKKYSLLAHWCSLQSSCFPNQRAQVRIHSNLQQLLQNISLYTFNCVLNTRKEKNIHSLYLSLSNSHFNLYHLVVVGTSQKQRKNLLQSISEQIAFQKRASPSLLPTTTTTKTLVHFTFIHRKI